MNKKFLCLIGFIFLIGCNASYIPTTFYVKNTTEKILNFKASIMKYSSIMGLHEMTLPFQAFPHDSVIARRVNYHKDAQPHKWFTRFVIFPTDSVVFNNAEDPANWKKSLDTKGKTVYTFTMNKE